jgi:hypothetical protein
MNCSKVIGVANATCAQDCFIAKANVCTWINMMIEDVELQNKAFKDGYDKGYKEGSKKERTIIDEFLDQAEEADVCGDLVEAKEHLRGLSFEEALKHPKAPRWAYWFARLVRKGQFKEGEPAIFTSRLYAAWYVADCLTEEQIRSKIEKLETANNLLREEIKRLNEIIGELERRNETS